MTRQHQRDNNEGRSKDGEAATVSQATARHGPTLEMEGPNSPKGCSMQRLVGHQRRPVGSV